MNKEREWLEFHLEQYPFIGSFVAQTSTRWISHPSFVSSVINGRRYTLFVDEELRNQTVAYTNGAREETSLP